MSRQLSGESSDFLLNGDISSVSFDHRLALRVEGDGTAGFLVSPDQRYGLAFLACR